MVSMSKTEKDSFNFIKHADYDVSKIKQLINNFDKDWLINTKRQEAFEAHRDTETYFIYENYETDDASRKYSVKSMTDNVELISLVEPIISDLEKIHNGQRGLVALIKLFPNKSVKPHRDLGEYLKNVRRHHISILTSENVVFGVGSEEISMKIGECWEINNTKRHYVINNSGTARINLMIDIVPGDRI